MKNTNLSVFGQLPFIGAIVLLAFLGAGCNLFTSAPPPSKVVLNGYTTDPTTGNAQFNLSAFDSQNNLLTTGTVSSPSVSNLRSNNGTPTATASVCGQIVYQDRVTAAIVLDSTGSMSLNDPNRDRNAAAKQFVSRMTVNDKAAVASFDTNTSPTSPYLAIRVWQDFTNDKSLLNAAIDRATFAGGNTNLWDAVYDSADLVNNKGVNPIALILTDGINNAGRRSSNDAIANAKSKGVRVYMVGLGDPNSLSFTEMQRVARETGGTFAAVRNAQDLSQLFDGIFNATRASFCIQVTFRINGNPPAPGTNIQGTLSFLVNNAPFSTDFDVTF